MLRSRSLSLQPYPHVEFEGLLVDMGCQNDIFDSHSKGIHKNNIVEMLSSNLVTSDYFSNFSIDASLWLSILDIVNRLVGSNDLPCSIHSSNQTPWVTLDQIPAIHDNFISLKNNLW